MYIIKNIKNNSYYCKTIFKGQRHFTCDVREAKRMSYDYALKILNNFKKKENYEIKEITK